MALKKTTLAEFLAGPFRNQWIAAPKLQAYVRRSTRRLPVLPRGYVEHIDGNPFNNAIDNLVIHDMEMGLDIANVSVSSRFRGKGIFTKWLDDAEKLAVVHGLKYVYVESILNERLIPFLAARGYQMAGTTPPSMFKGIMLPETPDKSWAATRTDFCDGCGDRVPVGKAPLALVKKMGLDVKMYPGHSDWCQQCVADAINGPVVLYGI